MKLKNGIDCGFLVGMTFSVGREHVPFCLLIDTDILRMKESSLDGRQQKTQLVAL